MNKIMLYFIKKIINFFELFDHSKSLILIFIKLN